MNKINNIQDELDSIIFNIEDLNYDNVEDSLKDLKKVNKRLKEYIKELGEKQ